MNHQLFYVYIAYDTHVFNWCKRSIFFRVSVPKVVMNMRYKIAAALALTLVIGLAFGEYAADSELPITGARAESCGG